MGLLLRRLRLPRWGALVIRYSDPASGRTLPIEVVRHFGGAQGVTVTLV